MHSSARRPALITIVGCCVGLIAARDPRRRSACDEPRVRPTTTTVSAKSPMWRSTEPNYFAVWEDYRSSHSDIYGVSGAARRAASLDPSGIPTHACEHVRGLRRPSPSGTGKYLVAWPTRRPACAARVCCPTAPFSTRTAFRFLRATSLRRAAPSAAAPRRRLSKDDGPTDSIHAARVDADGNVLDPNSIVLASGHVILTQAPRIAFHDGTNFLVVWAASARSGGRVRSATRA